MVVNCNIQYFNYISIVMVWNAMPFNSLNSNLSKMGRYFFNYFIEHSPRLKALLWLSSPNLKQIWEQRDIADLKKITFNWKKQVWEILFISKYNVYVFTVSINLARIQNVDTFFVTNENHYSHQQCYQEYKSVFRNHNIHSLVRFTSFKLCFFAIV